MIKAFAPKILYDCIGRYITANVKNRSDIILRLWTDHCEYIVAQRLRRGQQMITHYRKIWDDKALKDLLQRLRRQFQRRAKTIMLSSVGIQLTFDWDSERISYDSIQKYVDEMDVVWQLQDETILCTKCKKRLPINGKIEGIDYCLCSTHKSVHTESRHERWQPYLERQNMIIWRRKEQHGLYAYKVYASYPDITAEDFLYVQTDIDYRKQWDKTAVELKIVDADPTNQKNSHIIYWELLWPKLFANRDYVFNRRFFIDRTKKIIVIASKSVEHPACPISSINHRVREYWSYLIIKPKDGFKKPGLEYVLTYFDNPGVILPPAITAWVAQKQMPDFLNKLYYATVEYSQQRQKAEKKHDWVKLRDPGFEYPPDPEFIFNENGDSNDDDDDDDDDDKGSSDSGNKNRKEIDLKDVNKPDCKQKTRKSHWWNFFFATMYADPKD